MAHNNGGSTDEQLFEAYRNGDHDSFAVLVRRWTPTVRSVFKRGLPASEVDELVQEAFLLLHRSARDFRPGAPLRPWLLTIVFNLRRDRARRMGRRQRRLERWLQEPFDDVVQPPSVEQAQNSQRVHDALAVLSEAQREVIELRWFSDLSYPEIAHRIGGTAGAVKVRAYRACERLRAVLGEGLDPVVA